MKTPDLIRDVTKTAKEVHKELGPFLPEYCYLQALAIALTEAGFSVETGRKIPFAYRGHSIGEFDIPLIVNDSLAVFPCPIEFFGSCWIRKMTSHMVSSGFQHAVGLDFSWRWLKCRGVSLKKMPR